ncbi:DsrE family protein [Candidatus Bathyarchaeota archaeon]|nr:DsrE family protein [Candidatus Bathyarchaeota archaeon]
MQLLIIISTQEKLKHIIGLTNSAINKGHKVTLFFNEDSILLLKKPSLFEKINAELLICRTSYSQFKIGSQNHFIDKIKMSSLTELVELFEESEKIVFM